MKRTFISDQPIRNAALLSFLLMLLGAVSPADAQASSPLGNALKARGSAETAAPARTPSLEEEMAAVKQRELDAWQAVSAAGDAQVSLVVTGLGISQSEIDERQAMLGRLPRIYEQHLDTLNEIKEVRRARADLESQIVSWQGFEDKPPYPVDFVDGLREEVHAAWIDTVGLQAELDQLLSELPVNQDNLDKSARDLRLLSEQIERGGRDTKEREALLWRRNFEALRGRFIGARIAMNYASRRLLGEQISLANRRKVFAQRQVSVAAAASPFTREELARKFDALEAANRGFSEELKRAVVAADQAAARLTEARETLRRASKDAEARGAAAPDTGALEDELGLRQIEAETARIRVDTLKLLRDATEGERVIWRQRFTGFRSKDPADHAASEVLIARVQPLAQARRLALGTRFDLSQSLEDSEADRAADGTLSAEEALVSHAARASYQERAKVLLRGIQAVRGVEGLLRHWQQEIAEMRARIPPVVRMKAALKQSGGLALKAWNFELFAVEDTVLVEGQKVTTERGVTVGKILLAILILTVGILLTVRFGRLTYRIAIRRFRAQESVAALAEKFFLIIFSAIAVVIAFTTVRIPLTVFAFFGGALAIGVGFGAQNLINNFISGVILLIERPIKLGDIVDVDGVRGRVVSVGSRCCQVRRNDGIDLLIPNSAFLEKNVINWTLSDPLLRFSVEVGVAYGSPVEQVRALLEKAASSHAKILKERAPQVMFEGFGDSALQFSVYFWIAVHVTDDYRVTLSDVRFEIDRLFREAGITIAFPQRDVHLSSAAPVEVRIVDGADGP